MNSTDLSDMFAKGTYANASTSTAPAGVITLDALEHVADALRALGPEPIGEWMRQQGKPPENWILMLPESLRGGLEFLDFMPDYVKFSRMALRPLFVSRSSFAQVSGVIKGLARR